MAYTVWVLRGPGRWEPKDFAAPWDAAMSEYVRGQRDPVRVTQDVEGPAGVLAGAKITSPSNTRAVGSQIRFRPRPLDAKGRDLAPEERAKLRYSWRLESPLGKNHILWPESADPCAYRFCSTPLAGYYTASLTITDPATGKRYEASLTLVVPS